MTIRSAYNILQVTHSARVTEEFYLPFLPHLSYPATWVAASNGSRCCRSLTKSSWSMGTLSLSVLRICFNYIHTKSVVAAQAAHIWFIADRIYAKWGSCHCHCCWLLLHTEYTPRRRWWGLCSKTRCTTLMSLCSISIHLALNNNQAYKQASYFILNPPSYLWVRLSSS